MINKVTLLGHLGKDPIVRRTEAGVPVATFSLATNESYKDKEGNRQDKTEWHNIVVWRGLAEVAEKYLKKGALIYLEGKLTTRSYTQENITKYITEIVVDNFKMLDGRRENSGGNQNNPQATPMPEPPPTKDFNDDNNVDDLPF
jgi:single-strand DNA-binding protein